MRQYLLDTSVLGAYLQGRSGALSLAQVWIHNDEAATSIVVYGEIIEYLKGFAEFPKHQVAPRIPDLSCMHLPLHALKD